MKAEDQAGGAPLLTAEELQRLCELVYRRTGIAYGEPKRAYVERRLAERLAATGQPGFSGYMALLRSSGAEAEQLINSLTVNETYFYREEHQLRCLARDLLPEVIRRRGPGDLVRIWSMPCSTGEEAYSIALWLLENWPLVDAYHVEIVGSDIDSRALSEALRAEYGERALARLPPSVLTDYFEPVRGGARRLIRDLRESVSFTQANLVDAESMARQGGFDVIFCRNVLIYFDEASRRQAAGLLWNALTPGGFLCLGHSESMARISDRFAMRRFEEAVVYQRPLS
ncbi:chemotaxis protein CheR [Pseudoroseomonas deserti]|uniref:protein-glutamate O-methyltransferase n=1 Tax=Teichococcus deserti TaxID=1817963 RepID=A0A1V2H5Q8_9PROT|nr:protein-glutamate O-methyltransferase CheR [Pseudoroseomonas deserti]ONG56744.1 chemotaxis protein CheR [Pseudoroseomonas deserti]